MRTITAFLLLSAAATAAPASAPAPDAARLYRIRCASCHGNDGEGGVGASFRRKMYHSNSESIADVIKNGIPGTAMPASGLPEPAVKKLAAYVIYLNKRK